LQTAFKGQVQQATPGFAGEANPTLEILRFQVRLAKDLQCLKVESNALATNSIDEIGQPQPSGLCLDFGSGWTWHTGCIDLQPSLDTRLAAR
jgi:hypothetical protein